MAQNIKTIVKVFIIFFLFQISLSAILTAVPLMNGDISSEDINFINFLTTKTNFIGTDTGTLLSDFVAGMPSEGVFNDTLLNTFLGIYKIIAASIKFIVELALNLLVAPNVIMSILLYNFIGNVALLSIAGVAVNIGFYSFLYYIVFKEGIS
jgi:hypothetical protein